MKINTKDIYTDVLHRDVDVSCIYDMNEKDVSGMYDSMMDVYDRLHDGIIKDSMSNAIEVYKYIRDDIDSISSIRSKVKKDLENSIQMERELNELEYKTPFLMDKLFSSDEGLCYKEYTNWSREVELLDKRESDIDYVIEDLNRSIKDDVYLKQFIKLSEEVKRIRMENEAMNNSIRDVINPSENMDDT